ncbi:hypothetical protein SAMN02746041_00813 [Desulfacinum hydrothermale DSM 13146]|uniref:Uncharacterized protein n=1 Tax=Desulfacinum hydrothermale DSM 13146 TaxID=1121390 RepID=A0A1W1X8E4_9BACT|nr:polysaccharide deacetylase [Desulfacinum hydrothermale]SMC20100.1 hypothetical protein SAMN02746041_00813 [Desulfacinum hydrothermale DSM 13146]
MWAPSYWTRSISILFVSAWILLSAPQTGLAEGTPLARRVLVIYGEGQSERDNPVFSHAGGVLHHLGLLMDYWDVNRRPLPDDTMMENVRAVIVTLRHPVESNRTSYLQWLQHQLDSGRKLVVLGLLGVDPQRGESTERKLVADIWKRLGVHYSGLDITPAWKRRYVFKNTQMVEWERRYPPFPPPVYRAEKVDAALTAHLVVSVQGSDEDPAVLVGTHPNGGFAFPGTFIWTDPETFDTQWYVDPFLFFSKALDLETLPTPDPTTLNGLRVAFSHIDGDGFGGYTEIKGYENCAEVIRDEILKAFDFPVTASVITAEVDPQTLGRPALKALAREIFRLPNVEPASHSFSHPFYWDPKDVGKSRYHRLHGLQVPGYHFDPEQEIVGSAAYISRELAPEGKPCRLFLWTGNCRPRPEDMALCDKAGLLNMNGGDTLWDAAHPSVSYVSPFFWRLGDHLQVLTGQANENILTNLWSGPYFGYRNVIETMKRTEKPRRLKPIDIYYHYYSAQYEASLQALKEVYQWVLAQEIAPVFTSQYIRMVQGFATARIFQAAPDTFEVENYGHCLTVRFDRSDRVPDLDRSQNVVGYLRMDHCLYVSLQPGGSKARIVLAPAESPPPRQPHVRKATGWVTLLKRDPQSLEAAYRGFGRRGWIEWAGVRPGAEVKAEGSALPSGPMRASADESGYLRLSPLQTGSLKLSWR